MSWQPVRRAGSSKSSIIGWPSCVNKPPEWQFCLWIFWEGGPAHGTPATCRSQPWRSLIPGPRISWTRYDPLPALMAPAIRAPATSATPASPHLENQPRLRADLRGQLKRHPDRQRVVVALHPREHGPVITVSIAESTPSNRPLPLDTPALRQLLDPHDAHRCLRVAVPKHDRPVDRSAECDS